MKIPVSADPVLVDTSIWIDYFRGNPGVVARMLALMEEDRIRVIPLVLGELFLGTRSEAENEVVSDLERVFRPVSEPPAAWPRAGMLCATLHRKGFFPGLADAFLAICASEARVSIWTRDAHFRQIRDLSGLPLELFDPG